MSEPVSLDSSIDSSQYLAGQRARRPRIWTVWLTLVVATVTALGAQFVGAIGVVIYGVVSTDNSPPPASLKDEIEGLATSPIAMMLVSGLSQLAVAAVVFVAAWRSPQPIKQRLGLVPSRLPWSVTAFAVVGALVPAAAGVGLVRWLDRYITIDPYVEMAYSNMRMGTGLAFLLYMALVPVFIEELLFRGYVQRRLLDRCSPGFAIVFTALVFAAFHVMPHAMVLLFPLGVWLGILTCRSGSVWPAIVCRAAVSSGWNGWKIAAALGYIPSEAPLAVLLVTSCLGAAAFVWSLWRMMFPARGKSIS